jgi:hypothetical protein
MSVVEIFIAYSHNDLGYKNELKKFLRPLLNTGKARVWDDYDIEAGKDWEAEIKKRLYGADIIVLLVSPDSLASDYFYGNEVSVSLDRHSKNEAVVIPIILRPCPWTLTPIGALEVLPDKGRPVTKYDLQDDAFTIIVNKMHDTIQEISSVRKLASELEIKYRNFEAVVHTAEHLYNKNEWAVAKTSYIEAIQLHQSGFMPDVDIMQQRIKICEEKESELLVRQAFEGRLADFLVIAQDAEVLYKNENWKEAKKRYGELIKHYETGFPGEPTEFRRRQLECEQGLLEQERIAKEEKQKQDSFQNQLNDAQRHLRKRAYYKALESANIARAILPNSEEADSLIKIAEAGILRMPEEMRQARKKYTIITGVTIFLLIIFSLIGSLLYEKLQKVKIENAFEQASNSSYLPAWRNFLRDYPNSPYEEQARDSIDVIEKKIKKIEENAKHWLEDAKNPEFRSNRKAIRRYARKELETILRFDSTNNFAVTNLYILSKK